MKGDIKKFQKMNKKGFDFNMLTQGAIGLIVLIFIVTVGTIMASNLRSATTGTDWGSVIIVNSIGNNSVLAMQTFGSFFGLIVTILVLVGVLVFLISSIARGLGNKS